MRPTTISALAATDERLDVIFLIGVLEHLAMWKILCCLSAALKPNGYLYFEVPDATRYAQWEGAPYQFFSMEHINFFSPVSLQNLLARFGYRCCFAQREARPLSERAVELAVAALFQLDAGVSADAAAVRFDQETRPTLADYIARSQRLEQRINGKITALARAQTPLVVWGVGTHTLRLLRTSPLAEANIVAFLDSNQRYQGKMLHGTPILAPAVFRDRTATILISSHVAEQEIKQQIQKTLRWTNPIVCLYEDEPDAGGGQA